MYRTQTVPYVYALIFCRYHLRVLPISEESATDAKITAKDLESGETEASKVSETVTAKDKTSLLSCVHTAAAAS